MFSSLFAIIGPVLALASIGYFWARSDTHFPSDFVTRLVLNIAAPCLIISKIGQTEMPLGMLTTVSMAALASVAIMLIVTAVICKISGLKPESYSASMAFANSGNMGLPLCFFAFGEEGLALSLAWFISMAVVQFSLGMAIMNRADGWKRILLDLATRPLIYAIVIAVIMLTYQITLPLWLLNTTTMLGNVAVPLMLLTLGVSLSQIQLSDIKLSLLFGSLRVVGGFGVGLLLVEGFELTGMIAGVVIIQATMPVAVFNYLMALKFNREPSTIAGLVVASTFLSFLSLPWVITYAQQL